MTFLAKAHLIRAKVYGLRHPDEPWMAPSAIRWLDGHLDGGVGVEWGSGRSTPWFAARLDRLLSIEHDRGWYEALQPKVPANVDLRFVALDHDPEEPTRPHYWPVPAYVAVADEMGDSSIDLAVVDGHYREACIQQILPKVRPHGLLVVDNSDWLPAWGVPAAWPVEHRGRHGYGETTVWRRA